MFTLESMLVLFMIGIIIFTIIDVFLDSDGWFFIISSIILSVVIFTNVPTDKKFKEFESTEVHSTAMNYNSIQGSFFLGSGYINSREMYSANIYEDGAYERFYIPVLNTRRIIDENLNDTAVYMRATCEYIPTWLFTRNSGNDKCPNDIKKDELFIPKNTLIKKLNFQ